MGRGSNNNRDSRSQRAEFFSTQEKMSHTPTQNTASLVACCRWRYGISASSLLYNLSAKLLLENEEPIKEPLSLNLQTKNKLKQQKHSNNINWNGVNCTCRVIYNTPNVNEDMPCKQLCQANSDLTVAKIHLSGNLQTNENEKNKWKIPPLKYLMYHIWHMRFCELLWLHHHCDFHPLEKPG